MRCLLTLLLLLPLLSGCGLGPTATPDIVATQMAMNTASVGTSTARALWITPAVTRTPSATPSPLDTALPAQTQPPPDTPSTWLRFESAEYGIAFEYPTQCRVEQVSASEWQVTDTQEERFVLVGVVDDPPQEWLNAPLADLADLTLAWLFRQHDAPQEDFRFLSLQRTDACGVPGVVVRYDAEEGELALEMLVLRSSARVWWFFFAARSLGGWFEGMKESISVTLRSAMPTPELSATASNSPTPRPPPSPTAGKPPAPQLTPTPTPTLVGIGEQTEAGTWVFSVTEVQYQKALYLRDRSRVAMGVYCVLFLDIQNRASGTTSFGDLRWSLLDADGGLYDGDEATIYAAWQFGGKDVPWKDLNPGQVAQIVIALDVVEGAKGLQFYSRQLQQPFVYIGDAQPGQDQQGQ